MNCRSCTSLCAIHVLVITWKWLQASESGIEQPHSTSRRGPALHVVIRGGELNETLQELLALAFGSEPELFPGFVGVPELVGVEEGDALFDGAQSDARVPFFNTSQMATVKSVVEPVPPMSRVRCSSPIPSTFTIAS